MKKPVLVHFDFETRSKVDLKKCGAYRYALDKSTKVLCASWQYEDADGKLGSVHTWFFKKGFGLDQFANYKEVGILSRHISCGIKFKAHNAEFEFAVWNLCFRRQIREIIDRAKLARLSIDQLYCSAAEAAAMNYPRDLSGLCAAVNSETKKDLDGKRIMLKLARPRKPTKNDPSEWNENAEDFRTLVRYNRDDVRAEVSAGRKLKPLSKKELEIYRLTVRMNSRGLPINRQRVELCYKTLCQYDEEVRQKLSDATGGRVTGPRQVKRINEYLSEHGLSLPNLQKDTVADALKKDMPAECREVLELRQALSGSASSKFKTFLDAVCPDDRVRGSLLYCGAQATGRFSGRGVQPQNLKKARVQDDVYDIQGVLELDDYQFFKMIYPDVNRALSDTLRGVIEAPKGKKFFDVDWSAIEARIILYLAGDEEGLQTYRDGIDAYKKLAAIIFAKDISEVSQDERNYFGKPGELGCGYGLGWENAMAQFKVSKKMALKIVNSYRKLHAAVRDFWSNLEDAAIEAIEKPGKKVRCGDHLLFYYNRKWLNMRLPSGRLLYYHNPRVRLVRKVIKWQQYIEETDSYKAMETLKVSPEIDCSHWLGGKEFRKKLYGGMLAEHASSGTARDVMCYGMLRSDPEFPTILTVHDEVMAEVPDGYEYEEKERFVELLSEDESFLPDLPLKTSFWQHTQFGKH